MKRSLTCQQVKVMQAGVYFFHLCVQLMKLKWTWAGKTCSRHVLGNRKTTVKSWILFQSVNWQHPSASIPGYPLWINLFLIFIGQLTACYRPLSTLRTTVCDLSSEKSEMQMNSTSYVRTAGDLTPSPFIHVRTLLVSANALKNDTKTLISCKQEHPPSPFAIPQTRPPVPMS